MKVVFLNQIKMMHEMNKAGNNSKISIISLKGLGNLNGYYSELLSKLNEAEEWMMQPVNQNDSKTSWDIDSSKKAEYDRNLEQFNYLIGYLGNAKDKLQDELIFKSDNVRKIEIQMRRMRNDLESQKSLLEELVERRDTAREAYNHIKAEKGQIDREDKNYILIIEKYHCLKRKKEDADNAARNNAKQYENRLQNLKLIEISAEQSRMSLKDDKNIAAYIEGALEKINVIYHQIVDLM